jgi:secreted trypsin-like serine protease
VLWKTSKKYDWRIKSIFNFDEIFQNLFQGDSGGPLMVQNPSGVYVLAGITSYGVKQCGQSNLPGKIRLG